MFDATRYIPENDVDWHALADELFPADALVTVPAINPYALVSLRKTA